MSTSAVAVFREEIRLSIAAKEALLGDERLLARLDSLATSCAKALRSGRTLIFAGNGGSFADAQHLAAEFTSRFLKDRVPLPGLALGTNSSSMSAIGNDYGFDQVFARELRANGRPGDVFIPITTSGNSPNILEAVRVARELGIETVALTGGTGGKLRDTCDCVCVPSAVTARIQECHILIGHMLCGRAEALYFAASA